MKCDSTLSNMVCVITQNMLSDYNYYALEPLECNPESNKTLGIQISRQDNEVLILKKTTCKIST